jgi:hypothetical protein
MITCLKCLRTFAHFLGEAIAPIHEGGCVYCHSLIHHAIVQPAMAAPPQVFERKPSTAMPTALELLDFN